MGEVRSQDAPFLIRILLWNRHAGPATWARVEAAWDEFPGKFPSNTLPRMLDGVRGLCSPPELAAEVTAFVEAHPLAAGGRTVEQILERLAMSVAFGRREGPGLAAAVAGTLGPR
jgi:puromycin-sensitive aminopeptidase